VEIIMANIKQARLLIIATHGFEQAELEVPRDKLKEAGANVTIASLDGKEIRVGIAPTGAGPRRWI
jgi:protease I